MGSLALEGILDCGCSEVAQWCIDITWKGQLCVTIIVDMI